MLITDEYQDKAAWSIFCGILEYFANEETFYWDRIQTPYTNLADKPLRSLIVTIIRKSEIIYTIGDYRV